MECLIAVAVDSGLKLESGGVRPEQSCALAKTKKAAVLAFVAASCTLLFCSLILSVPSLDDALTGRPEYLRGSQTERLAPWPQEPTVNSRHARHDDAYDCDKIETRPPGQQ